MEHIVELRNLTKQYGRLQALDRITFSLESGKIHGLLGRNGAGKTTLMRILTAQLFPTRGEVKVYGASPFENNSVLSQICFVKEDQAYPDNFRVEDVLAVSPNFFPYWDAAYANRLIQDFQLPLRRRIKKLSRGMRSSLGIVVGLASRAPLTIFDEPYIGLDAVARHMFYDQLLDDYSTYPRTVILSTHLIDEVSQMLNHVILIDQGRLLINESADSLRTKAYTVAGASAAVESFANGKKVIHRASIGALATATVIGEWNRHVRSQVEGLGLEFTPTPLQQLFVHLTRDNETKEVANVR